jgi:hypothetical protein
MLAVARDIGTETRKIAELVTEIQQDKLLVPTFQRDFVWQPAQILKLWDSMYRFYPIGSILYWETDAFLHTHRQLGGFAFPHDDDTIRRFLSWRYILDGQQRATAIFVSMLGGKGRVEDNEEFDYTLYFDPTDDERPFFFTQHLANRQSALRNKGISPELILPVHDVPALDFARSQRLASLQGYTPAIGEAISRLQRMFFQYSLSLIRIRGVDVNEVCDIFERINQEGRKLDTVDIVIARTYRVAEPQRNVKLFYLRDLLKDITDTLAEQGSRWQELEDLTLLQMIGICVRKQSTAARNPYGITPAALYNLTSDDIERVWGDCRRAILDTLKFLTDQKIHGPRLLPYSYLVLPLCYHFFRNPSPNRNLARQWLWSTMFRTTSFDTSTAVYQQCDGFFTHLNRGESPAIDPLTFSLSRLTQASYRFNNALSRAILAFLAYLGPCDFTDPRADVLDNVYLDIRQSPNLHHIYPRSFLARGGRLPAGVSQDSLMNICYLRTLTNSQISNRNPLEYFAAYAQVPHFDTILASHLIPKEFISRPTYQPDDYRDFLHARSGLFAERFKRELPDVHVTITD